MDLYTLPFLVSSPLLNEMKNPSMRAVIFTLVIDLSTALLYTGTGCHFGRIGRTSKCLSLGAS